MNQRASRIASVVVLFSFLVLLTVDLLVYLPSGEAYYLYLDLLLPFFAATLFILSSPTWSLRAWRTGIIVVVTSIMAWAGVLTALAGTPYTYFITAFLMSGVLLLSPGVASLAFGAGFGTYLVTMLLGAGSVLEHWPTLILELLGMTGAAWVVSQVLYRARTTAIETNARLEAVTAHQAQEIARQTEELQTANAALSERLAEREVLLREIHHRVKNNLQILRSLFSLAEDHPSSGGVRATLDSAEHRIQAMALVHQRLYDSQTLESVGLAGYLEDLATYVVVSYDGRNRLALRTSLDECRVSIDLALNVGLIVCEAISNAAIHAFEDVSAQAAPRIDLTLQTNEAGAHLTVADNGCGFSTAVSHTGLGALLMETLAQQISAQLEVTSSAAGTLVRCTVPLSPPSTSAAAK